MALNSFSSGVNTSFSSQLNNNFRADSIKQIYTGTGINSSVSGTASSTVTASVELTAIASSSLGNADYLRIELVLYCSATCYENAGDRNIPTNSLKIETKQVGGSYADSLATTAIQYFMDGDATGAVTDNDTITYIYYHTLTAGEKSNGVQVKITGQSAIVASGSPGEALASITNRQIIISTAV